LADLELAMGFTWFKTPEFRSLMLNMPRADRTDKALQDRLGYHFSNPALLDQALTHVSAQSTPLSMAPDYQRLEFLGDRVLGLIIADLLYRTFPEESEGKLSRRLGTLVRRETCAEIAREWDLAAHLRVGQAERRSGLRNREAILADVCEAVIAAIWLDGGLDSAKMVVERSFGPRLLQADGAMRDSKSALQEWALGLGLGTPEYVSMSRTGPDHKPVFKIAVSIQGHENTFGEGPSKRVAEQNAARAFMVRLGLVKEGQDG
jgi:ribonuclease III